MVLGDLSLSASSQMGSVKSALENRLGSILPMGSFSVIIRNYQGDFRARNTNQPNFNAVILIDAAGRKIALQRKTDLEALGFLVSSNGDVRLNWNSYSR